MPKALCKILAKKVGRKLNLTVWWIDRQTMRFAVWASLTNLIPTKFSSCTVWFVQCVYLVLVPLLYPGPRITSRTRLSFSMMHTHEASPCTINSIMVDKINYSGMPVCKDNSCGTSVSCFSWSILLMRLSFLFLNRPASSVSLFLSLCSSLRLSLS